MSQTKSIIAENPARKVRYLELAKTSDEKFILKEMFPFLEEKGIDISNFRIDIINFIMSYTLKTYRFIRMLHRTYEADSVIEGHKDEYKFYDFFIFLIETLSNQLTRHDISYKNGLNKDRTTLEEMTKKYRTTNDIVIDDVLSIYLVNLFLNEPNETLDIIQSETIKENLKVFYFKLFAENARFAPSEEVMNDILYFCKMDFNDIRNMFSVYRRLPDVLSKKSNWNINYNSSSIANESLNDAFGGYVLIERLQLLRSSLDSQTGAFTDFVHYQGMFPLDKKFDSITLNSKEYVYSFIKKLRHTEWNYYLSEAHRIYKEYLKSYLKQLELPRSERSAMYDVSFSAVTSYIHAIEGMFEDGSFIHFIDGIKYVEDGRRNLPIFAKEFTIEYLQSDKILKNFIASRMETFNSHDAYEYEETRQKAIKDFENRMDNYERHSSVNPYKMQDLFTAFIAKFQGRSFTKNQLDWGERFKTYDDGLFWEFLPEGRSEKERHAMNHCGNMGRINDIMYSLRSEKKGKYNVHVTATVTKDGYLMETKSYGNNEPSVKYQKHLIDLFISSPYIKCVGNEYNGHKPEVNFTFHKFSKEQKRKVQKELPLASINKYSIYESLVSSVSDYIEEYPEDKDSNDFVFYDGNIRDEYSTSEILFHNHTPLLVLNLAQVGNEIEDRMGVFPYHLQKISLVSYIDSKEMFIKILDELVSYFDMNTGSKEIMIPSSFMINLNEIITTLPREWEDDIVSSKAIEKIKEINKHFEEDFIKYKCIEISRDVRGDEWSFDDKLNYVRFFDYSEHFLGFFSKVFAGGRSELESLIDDALDDSTGRGFDVEVSRYEMQENSIGSHKFWDEFKKTETIKKMSKDQLSNFYSWFHNFENVLQNDRRPIKDYDYEYYEFYKNLDLKNPVAVTSNIWMILFNAKETSIASCLEASSYESFKESVIDYVMNPENFHDSEDKFRINNYWSFDTVEVEGEKKYKMSFDTQRFVKEFFSYQSEFEYEGIELKIDTNWMAEKNTRRRGFEIDSYVDHDNFVSEFSYRLFEADVSDEVIEYMKKNKCPITSSSQLDSDYTEEETDND